MPARGRPPQAAARRAGLEDGRNRNEGLPNCCLKSANRPIPRPAAWRRARPPTRSFACQAYPLLTRGCRRSVPPVCPMARNPRLANQALRQELLSRPRSYRGSERRKRSSALPRRQPTRVLAHVALSPLLHGPVAHTAQRPLGRAYGGAGRVSGSNAGTRRRRRGRTARGRR